MATIYVDGLKEVFSIIPISTPSKAIGKRHSKEIKHIVQADVNTKTFSYDHLDNHKKEKAKAKYVEWNKNHYNEIKKNSSSLVCRFGDKGWVYSAGDHAWVIWKLESNKCFTPENSHFVFREFAETKRSVNGAPVIASAEIVVVTDYSVYLAQQQYANSTNSTFVLQQMKIYYAHSIYAVCLFFLLSIGIFPYLCLKYIIILNQRQAFAISTHCHQILI